MFIRYKTEELLQILQAQVDDIITLTRAGQVTFLREEDPAVDGCCVKVVNDQCSILVQLKGLIDVDSELTRLGKQRDKVLPALEGLQRKMAAADYTTKVPENVREQNSQKAAQYEIELESINQAISAFESMR